MLHGVVRAQEKLQQLVRAHDDHGTYAPLLSLSSSRRPLTTALGRSPEPAWAAEAPAPAPMHHHHHHHHAVEQSPLPPSPLGPPPSPMDAGLHADAADTWTGAMGVTDVHSRLYGASER